MNECIKYKKNGKNDKIYIDICKKSYIILM